MYKSSKSQILLTLDPQASREIMGVGKILYTTVGGGFRLSVGHDVFFSPRRCSRLRILRKLAIGRFAPRAEVVAKPLLRREGGRVDPAGETAFPPRYALFW